MSTNHFLGGSPLKFIATYIYIYICIYASGIGIPKTEDEGKEMNPVALVPEKRKPVGWFLSEAFHFSFPADARKVWVCVFGWRGQPKINTWFFVFGACLFWGGLPGKPTKGFHPLPHTLWLLGSIPCPNFKKGVADAPLFAF